MDQATVKLGLLMETAQSHQKLAAAAIEKLDEYSQGLPALLKEQVRQVLREELQVLQAETQSAAAALRALKRAANARTTFWTLGITAISAAITLLIAWWVLPKPAEIAELRKQRDELVLDRRGARADLRVCGPGRLCVRVDTKAPRYGDKRDYLVIRGY